MKVLKMSGYAQWIGLVGKILTGNHGFYHQISGVPLNFPIIQFHDMRDELKKTDARCPGALSGFLVGSIVPLDPHPKPVLGSGMLLYQN
jgi:hypothetical protein